MATNKMLYLLRHGEAEMAFGRQEDFNRQLTSNGIAQLKRLGKILALNATSFDQILSSSARRTKMTTDLINEFVPTSKIIFEEGLYEAFTEHILNYINQVDKNIDNLLLVGHNPGISAMASYITQGQFISMLPGMMAKISIEVECWSMVGRQTGILMEVLQ